MGARSRSVGVPAAVLEALDRYGIRYRIIDRELYLDGRDTARVLRLCDEDKLPRYICG